MKCCSDNPPECCANMSDKLDKMSYCCSLMDSDDDDDDAIFMRSCPMAMKKCMGGMEKESGEMDSQDAEKFGNCLFKVAADNENVKCIMAMMKDEDEDDRKFAMACMKEMATCMSVDGGFDDDCFMKEMMKNKE